MSRGFIGCWESNGEAVREMRAKEKRRGVWCILFTCVGSEGERLVIDTVNDALG